MFSYAFAGNTSVKLFLTERGIFAGWVFQHAFPKANQPAVCHVFLGCGRKAVKFIKNPVLGDVPACAKCHAWFHGMAGDASGSKTDGMAPGAPVGDEDPANDPDHWAHSLPPNDEDDDIVYPGPGELGHPHEG